MSGSGEFFARCKRSEWFLRSLSYRGMPSEFLMHLGGLFSQQSETRDGRQHLLRIVISCLIGSIIGCSIGLWLNRFYLNLR